MLLATSTDFAHRILILHVLLKMQFFTTTDGLRLSEELPICKLIDSVMPINSELVIVNDLETPLIHLIKQLIRKIGTL